MFNLDIVRQWYNPTEFLRRVQVERMILAEKCADYIAQQARIYCPKDTLELHDSIHVVIASDGSGYYVIAPVEHAEPQEFGFIHWISRKRIPAKAFMRRAVRDAAREFPHILGDSRVLQGFHHGRLMGVAITP